MAPNDGEHDPMDVDRHRQFTERVVHNQRQVFSYIVSLVPNRADAEELFQQTCLALWEGWERYDLSLDFLPWACGIAHNQIRNFHRRKQNSQVRLDADMVDLLAVKCGQRQQREEDRLVLLRECLGRLPEKSRAVVEGYYGGQSVRELADSRSSSPNVIYKLLDKVRAALHECLSRRLAGGTE